MIGFSSTMVEPQNQKMWKWKMEPESPKGTSMEDVEDDWIMYNDKSLEFTKYAVDEPVMYDDQPTNRAHRAEKLLDELNELNEWIKEEPFSYWLEERTNLPIFEELENSECQNNKSVQPAVIKNQQEQYSIKSLLEEFETVLEDVEACHQIIPLSVSTLTPPQSPPPNKSLTVDTQLLVTLQPVEMIQPVISSQQQQLPVYNIIVSSEKQQQQQQQPVVYQNEVCIPEQWNPESVSLDPLGGEDVANDLAVVDEYVRSHTEDIPTAYSSCTSPSGSTASEDSISDDPDWIADISCDKKQSTSIDKKNRHKPYSRPTIEDKKVRKKEQNKNAATRYRQKKKQEIKDILGEEQELTEYNEKLQGQVKDLQREIGYLKGLMRDLFKAKGLIK